VATLREHGSDLAPETPAARGGTFGTPLDVNWLGLWTLYKKEVQRFVKVITQTVVAPMITTLIFLTVFTIALDRGGRTIGGLPFIEFLAPGLVMMSVIQNAFANSSSSLMIAKIQGNIVDYLMPPLNHWELVMGVVMGAVTRGLVVGLAVWLVMVPVAGAGVLNPLLALFYLLAASMALGLIGFVTALWAEKFDQLAAVTNFLVTPLSFLSGTFYAVDQLPDAFWWVAHLNPFFYMIDGLRFAITGYTDGTLWIGAAVIVAAVAALWWFTLHLVRRGYKIRP
jgi:ABC-2 type transport system permease protein